MLRLLASPPGCLGAPTSLHERPPNDPGRAGQRCVQHNLVLGVTHPRFRAPCCCHKLAVSAVGAAPRAGQGRAEPSQSTCPGRPLHTSDHGQPLIFMVAVVLLVAGVSHGPDEGPESISARASRLP